MGRMRLLSAMHLVGIPAVCLLSAAQAKPTFRPVPDGVTELTGFGADGGIVELKDGALMHASGGGINDASKIPAQYQLSKDGGKTWEAPQPLPSKIGVGGMIRLQSGELAIYGRKTSQGAGLWEYFFSTSPDDGKTWSEPTLISNYPSYYPMFHSLVQLKSGRLLLVGYWEGLNADPPDVQRYTITGAGIWHGKWLWCEGHRAVEMGICVVYYSDDKGATWNRAGGGLFGWFDQYGVPNGEGGIVDVYEPALAETKDGRVLLFARAKVGRLVQSHSVGGANQGTLWNSVLPTELSSSQSPPMLVQIPSTGDLLCIWNQVSFEEINRGFLRGRLSAAISKDSGLTWQNFKTLELQEGMDESARITPVFPIPRVTRARPSMGQLPEGFAMFSYPNVDIIGDKVFVRYGRSWAVERAGDWPKADPANVPLRWSDYEQRGAEMSGESVMRIYPLEYFYK